MGVNRWTDLTWHARLGPIEAMRSDKWDTLS
jgi:hypothetical protein